MPDTRAKTLTLAERERFGNWLTKSRESRGLSKSELGRLCGLSRQTINNVENANKEGDPPVATYVGLAKGLNLELGYVMHKAGYAIGNNDVNMDRLVRVEEALERLDRAEPELRRALAEELELASGERRARLAHSLFELDLVTERLRDRSTE